MQKMPTARHPQEKSSKQFADSTETEHPEPIVLLVTTTWNDAKTDRGKVPSDRDVDSPRICMPGVPSENQ